MHTKRAPFSLSLTPAFSSRFRSGTPVQTEQPVAAAPQLKPTVCLVMFCSLRLFPAHVTVHGNEIVSILESSSMVMVSGLLTAPPISIVCVSQSSLGTAPWSRTMWIAGGVIKPASINIVRGGSTLKGCRPVRRMRSG